MQRQKSSLVNSIYAMKRDRKTDHHKIFENNYCLYPESRGVEFVLCFINLYEYHIVSYYILIIKAIDCKNR